MSKVLEGLLVVSLEQAVAAPLCTSRLAEAGARVIKLERAEGDFARGYDSVVHGESAYFVWLNRGKQSLRIDLKDPADAALVERMLSKADVFVQNLAPGAAARSGFGSVDLRARYPRLITCDITGYGESGEAAGMKAYDFLIQCEAGLASITGTPDEPARVGVSVADIACGMNAHAAILQALIERGQTGKGRGIALSLFDGLADWMTVPLLHYDYGGKAPARAGLKHPSIAPYGAFPTADGSQIVVYPTAGDVSWMTAGRAVAHVERTPPSQLGQNKRTHGLQVWLALPEAEEQCEPAYSYHPAGSLPHSDAMGVQITLIAGTGFCLESPVPVRSPTLYAELRLAAGASLLIPNEYSERALYLIEGEAELDGETLPAHAMAVIPAGETPLLSACGECHLALIGGEPIGPRRMNWNFVASSAELIDQARQRWAAGDWPQVPGETARIELPR